MKIVADENIPFVEHYFKTDGELLLKPGRAISQRDLVDADILLVRSVTSVNQTLLHNTTVKFVGSTTSGIDHLDTDWLDQQGIAWSAAEGCNTNAVVEFVMASVFALQRLGCLPKKFRAGVIGAGRIGAKVADFLKKLNIDVVLCDPIRAAQEKDFISTPLSEFRDLDMVTLHTPLTHTGSHPTFHLIEKNFLSQQKKGCVLINTGRGAAINFADLKQYGPHLQWCLDVWENEPDIDLDVLQSTVIATPHIAGYSIQSKYRGIEMIYRAAIRAGVIEDASATPLALPRKKILLPHEMSLGEAMLTVYNPLETSVQMKAMLLAQPNSFDELRKNFPERHEFDLVDFLK